MLQSPRHRGPVSRHIAVSTSPAVRNVRTEKAMQEVEEICTLYLVAVSVIARTVPLATYGNRARNAADSGNTKYGTGPMTP